MQSGYVFLMSLDEVRSLSRATQEELAGLSPEFADMMGIATAANPPEKPKATRGRAKKGNETTILPETNQPNQMSAVDPTLAAYGAPNPNQLMGSMPPSPQIPSGMPMVTGLPGVSPPAPQGFHVHSPMPLPSPANNGAVGYPTQQPAPGPLYPPQPWNPTAPPAPAPQPAPQAAPPQQPMGQMPSAQEVRTVVIPKIFSSIPDAATKIGNAITKTQQSGHLNGDLTSLTDQSVPALLHFMREEGLISG